MGPRETRPILTGGIIAASTDVEAVVETDDDDDRYDEEPKAPERGLDPASEAVDVNDVEEVAIDVGDGHEETDDIDAREGEDVGEEDVEVGGEKEEER